MTSRFPLVDVHADLGRFPTQDVGPGTVDALIEQMDLLGIDRALVAHSLSYLQDPAAGNDLVLLETAGHERLLPCWTVLPDSCGELPTADLLIDRAIRCGVVAVRAYPASHGYRLDAASMDGVLGQAASAGLVLIVDCEQTTFEAVSVVAGRHPDLAVVVSHLGYRVLRDASDLLSGCPNTYVDLANLATHRGIEYLAARFGPSRLLFGTGAPLRDGAEAVTRLLWSDLDDAAVDAIGHGNIERILSTRSTS